MKFQMFKLELEKAEKPKVKLSTSTGHQAPLSMESARQEYWSSLPFPPPGDLPNPEIEPKSPALAPGLFINCCHLGRLIIAISVKCKAIILLKEIRRKYFIATG